MTQPINLNYLLPSRSVHVRSVIASSTRSSKPCSQVELIIKAVYVCMLQWVQLIPIYQRTSPTRAPTSPIMVSCKTGPTMVVCPSPVLPQYPTYYSYLKKCSPRLCSTSIVNRLIFVAWVRSVSYKALLHLPYLAICISLGIWISNNGS